MSKYHGTTSTTPAVVQSSRALTRSTSPSTSELTPIVAVPLHPHGQLVICRFEDPDGVEVTLAVESEGFEPLEWTMSTRVAPHPAWAVLTAALSGAR